MIDLRSDTVTLPPPEMMDCTYRAELGDDVYGENPTANKLQELAAEVTGKEAALLTTSGTMSNIPAFMTHCQHGDEVVVAEGHHAVIYELGAPASIAGVSFRILPVNEMASYDIELLDQVIRTATARVGVPAPLDIVVSSSSGYPLDLNLYQFVKARLCAPLCVARDSNPIANSLQALPLVRDSLQTPAMPDADILSSGLPSSSRMVFSFKMLSHVSLRRLRRRQSMLPSTGHLSRMQEGCTRTRFRRPKAGAHGSCCARITTSVLGRVAVAARRGLHGIGGFSQHRSEHRLAVGTRWVANALLQCSCIREDVGASQSGVGPSASQQKRSP